MTNMEIGTTEYIENDKKEELKVNQDIEPKEYTEENNTEESENEKIIKAIVKKLPFDNIFKNRTWYTYTNK